MKWFAPICVALLPLAARGQKDLASCKPVIDALVKRGPVAYHAYYTRTESTAGAKPKTSEMISAGGHHYVQLQGQWVRSPMTPDDLIKIEQDNLANAKGLSCRKLRDESVDGTPATVYVVHAQTDEATSEAQEWIARGSGVELRTESDIDTGDGYKTHMSSHYEYANVKAPIVP
jgi:hypothetical protein